jgi:hypothetical protein
MPIRRLTMRQQVEDWFHGLVSYRRSSGGGPAGPVIERIVAALDPIWLTVRNPEGMSVRQEAVVAAPPIDARWGTGKGVARLGPRAFGCDLDDLLVEALNA